MTQNIYDDEAFFAGYSRLPRSIEGLDGAPEWPALRALLPELRGLSVLDLGCGFGWFCRWTRERGAASVLGVDISDRMLARAKAETHDAAISYAKADLEHLDLPSRSFDLAYSSLALHYIENLEGLLAGMRAALVPGGGLIFSVEHPIFTAPANPGWSVDAAGRKIWPLMATSTRGRARQTGSPGRDQATPNDRNLRQPADPLGVLSVTCRGGGRARAGRGAAGLGRRASASSFLDCGLQPLGRHRRSSTGPAGLIEG
jgi:SAM-dependent methyltransferase